MTRKSLKFLHYICACISPVVVNLWFEMFKVYTCKTDVMNEYNAFNELLVYSITKCNKICNLKRVLLIKLISDRTL